MDRMKPVSALNGLGEPRYPILAVDPGKRCGLCLHHGRRARDGQRGAESWYTDTVSVDDAPTVLSDMVWALESRAFVVCEDFRLAGGNRSNAGATDMPASRVIGMLQVLCAQTDVPLFMAQRGVKRAGACALDTYGRAARAAAHNDHERDAVDICGYVLRQMRLPQQGA